LHERFWANGFELDQTVENPEPKLAPLPSLRAVSSEIELLQRSSSSFTGQFSDPLRGCKLRFGLCAFARNVYYFSRPGPQLLSHSSNHASLPPVEPLINSKGIQLVCQQIFTSTGYVIFKEKNV
jgi:hypothetical protein